MCGFENKEPLGCILICYVMVQVISYRGKPVMALWCFFSNTKKWKEWTARRLTVVDHSEKIFCKETNRRLFLLSGKIAKQTPPILPYHFVSFLLLGSFCTSDRNPTHNPPTHSIAHSSEHSSSRCMKCIGWGILKVVNIEKCGGWFYTFLALKLKLSYYTSRRCLRVEEV
jgi:hypothetical protein